MSDLLRVDTYQFTLSQPVKFGKIVFNSNIAVQIAVFGSGGGGGFGPIVSYQIKVGDKTIHEVERSEEGTPIMNFITENLGVLFTEV